MIKSIIPAVLLAVMITSCSKDKSAPVTETPVPEAPKPVSATFRISTDNLFENQEVVLTPEDTRAGNTYFWDFGLIANKRVTSDQMIPKMAIKNHGNYYVTLIVTDARGATATTTQFMPVLCSWDGTGTHP